MIRSPKFLALCSGLLLWSSMAHADEVVIRLGDGTQPAPSHVCVAAQTIRGLSPDEKSAQHGLSSRLEFVPESSSATVDASKLVTGLLASGAAAPGCAPAPVSASACGTWRAIDGNLKIEPGPCALPQRGACDAVVVEANLLAKDQVLTCHANTQPSSARGRFGVVVLDFQQAIIDSFSLTAQLARIQLVPIKSEQKVRPIIRVVGGTYLDSADVPLREVTGTDLVEFPLVPRCSEQRIVMPTYECPTALKDKGSDTVLLRTGTRELQVSRDELARAPTILVPNDRSLMAELRLSACLDASKEALPEPEDHFAHVLSARWHVGDPPEPRKLSPSRLQFSWERDGLVTDGECPKAPELVERGVKCLQVRAASDPSSCDYECAGAIELPSVVELSRPRTPSYPSEKHPAAAQVWELMLARPGQTLHGFVPASEAELSLHWCGWTDDQQRDRSTQWGEQIPSVRLGSGDGRTFRVVPNTPRLRVANVQRGDAFSITFDGKRVYKSDIARVGPGGVLTIWHPRAPRESMRPECSDLHAGVQSDLSADKVVFALALAGGLRSADGGETTTRWSPYGELDVIATIRAWRWHVSDFYLEPEIRAGVALTTALYAKGFDASSLEDDSRQRNVNVALFPVEVMAHFFDNQPLHFAVGPGIVFSRPLFSSDVGRVSNTPRVSLAINLGIGVSHAFAIDSDLRFIWGNQQVEKTFDEGGLSEQSVATFFMTMLGVRLRLNDAFDGGQAPSESPPEETLDAPPRAAAVGPPASGSAVASGPVQTAAPMPPPGP